nr:tagged CspB protein [Vector p19HXT]
MFNNRIRTAALAGAIAISTAASGLVVPAFAQETTLEFLNCCPGCCMEP